MRTEWTPEQVEPWPVVDGKREYPWTPEQVSAVEPSRERAKQCAREWRHEYRRTSRDIPHNCAREAVKFPHHFGWYAVCGVCGSFADIDAAS